MTVYNFVRELPLDVSPFPNLGGATVKGTRHGSLHCVLKPINACHRRLTAWLSVAVGSWSTGRYLRFDFRIPFLMPVTESPTTQMPVTVGGRNCSTCVHDGFARGGVKFGQMACVLHEAKRRSCCTFSQPWCMLNVWCIVNLIAFLYMLFFHTHTHSPHWKLE